MEEHCWFVVCAQLLFDNIVDVILNFTYLKKIYIYALVAQNTFTVDLPS